MNKYFKILMRVSPRKAISHVGRSGIEI